MNEKKSVLGAPDAQTFASAMGQAVWLMTMSDAHKDLRIRDIEKRIAPALLLRQFKLYFKGKQPIAFLTWGSVSDELKARVEGGAQLLDVKEWRSGTNIVVLDCVSPFNPPEEFISLFEASVQEARQNESKVIK